MFQNNNAADANLEGEIMEPPPPFDPVTLSLLDGEVDLIHDFFATRMEAASTDEGALIEDDDLPPKQRFPKPRLPPTGKISSPRKRPIKEQQQLARKKRKLEEGREEALLNGARPGTGDSTGAKGGPNGATPDTLEGGNGAKLSSLKLDPPRSNPPMPDPEKDEEATGMMSPPDSM
jgi:transcriptional activator SPT7